MIRYLFAIFFILSISVTAKANIQLSNNSSISVLTCSAGDELYSAFGHSAIRIFDSKNNIDLVFNYGTFDFDTPNFYLKFANGKLNYMLSVYDFKHFLPSYFKENRSVTEQILNLNQNDKQHIFNALLENYKPENRLYKYDFFFDNCATRIFNIINNHVENEIILNCNDSIGHESSFRDYMFYYLASSPWIDTGLNTILGLPADDIASLKESTFLPNFLFYVLDGATINNNQNSYSLVKETRYLLKQDLSQISKKSIAQPGYLFWGLLIFIILLSFFNRLKNLFNIVAHVLFIVPGVIGILITYLWFITDHQVCGNNLNILWAFPFAILLVIINFKKKLHQIILSVYIALLIIFIVGWYWIPQAFPNATLPFSVTLLYICTLLLKRNHQISIGNSKN